MPCGNQCGFAKRKNAEKERPRKEPSGEGASVIALKSSLMGNVVTAPHLRMDVVPLECQSDIPTDGIRCVLSMISIFCAPTISGYFAQARLCQPCRYKWRRSDLPGQSGTCPAYSQCRML